MLWMGNFCPDKFEKIREPFITYLGGITKWKLYLNRIFDSETYDVSGVVLEQIFAV